MILQKSFRYDDLLLKKHFLLSQIKLVVLVDIFKGNSDAFARFFDE